MRVIRYDLDAGYVETLVRNGDAENKADGADYFKWCVGITGR